MWTWEDREKTIEYYSDLFDISETEEAMTHPDLVCGEGRLAIPDGRRADILWHITEHLTFRGNAWDEDNW